MQAVGKQTGFGATEDALEMGDLSLSASSQLPLPCKCSSSSTSELAEPDLEVGLTCSKSMGSCPTTARALSFSRSSTATSAMEQSSSEESEESATTHISDSTGARRVSSLVRAQALNAALCLMLIAQSCLEPVISDLSRTATKFGAGTEHGIPVYPYEVTYLLAVVRTINVAIAAVALLTFAAPDGGLRSLLSWRLHLRVLPQSIVFAVSDTAAFYSVAAGDGPLYSAVYNSRMVFLAILARLLLSRRQSRAQLLWLLGICTSAAWFAFEESESDDLSDDLILQTLLWALVRAVLSAAGAVLTERNYRTSNIWETTVLTEGQGAIFILLLGIVRTHSGLTLPACGEGDVRPCIEGAGWDGWTLAVLGVYVVGSWLGAFTISRMNAMAKVLSKTLAGPVQFVIYAAAMPSVVATVTSSVAIGSLTVSVMGYSLSSKGGKKSASSGDGGDGHAESTPKTATTARQPTLAAGLSSSNSSKSRASNGDGGHGHSESTPETSTASGTPTLATGARTPASIEPVAQ